MRKIANTGLSIDDFFARYKDIPFSRPQYFRLKKQVAEGREPSLSPPGRKKRIGEREELFLSGVVASGAVPPIAELCEMVEAKLGTAVRRSVMQRALRELFPNHPRSGVGRPRTRSPAIVSNALGGFELIIAVAHYLKWPERVASVIGAAVRERKGKGDRAKARKDLRKRRRRGRFTRGYNRLKSVRGSRFASVSEKRKTKRWASMAIMNDSAATLYRKCLAILSLPVVTANGSVRHVNVPLGQSLKHLCGFDYKQKTITKFLGELKYLELAERLLRDLPAFWKECWKEDSAASAGRITCFYVDGNTKPVWSGKRIMQNKVTMLGRVMGCLEQVFIHDGLGHPIYFETHSGHGPVGEEILGMFDKIKSAIVEEPGARTQVCRAIVMDAASNSVGTLRAFADQQTYNFITNLDDNQWSERKICQRFTTSRYRERPATLEDVDIELTDSKNGYVIVVRAIKINWDNGKQTVLITNLPRSMVDASDVVYAYFRRWPAEELWFKRAKAAFSINRVCGYGKKLVENERVKKKLEELAAKKQRLEEKLGEELGTIADLDAKLVVLVKRESRLRAQTKIKDGERIVPAKLANELAPIMAEIKRHEAAKKRIIKERPKEFKAYRKTTQEWLRLQSKTTVYQLDVELDQILTYFRVCLAHLSAYFLRYFLDVKAITFAMLFHRINQLQAHVEVTRDTRKVTLVANAKDPEMMELLRGAISKLNDLNIRGDHGRVYRFAML